MPVSEYKPMQVKQSVVGYGGASKRQVMDMTRRILKLESLPRPDDAADAIAIALCHARSATSLLSSCTAAPIFRPPNGKIRRQPPAPSRKRTPEENFPPDIGSFRKLFQYFTDFKEVFMFYYLQGPITILEPSLAVVDCGGVGYSCAVTAYTAAQLKLNQNARLYVHENIREGAFDLFGFASRGAAVFPAFWASAA